MCRECATKKKHLGITTLDAYIWWGGWWGSNPRQPESQSGTLPAELQPPSEKLKITQALKPEINCFRNSLACPTGIEPVTPSLEGWCSIRLSYGHYSNRVYPKSIGYELVGVERFELPTSWSQTRRATRLRYTPEGRNYTFPLIKGQFSCLFRPIFPTWKESEN